MIFNKNKKIKLYFIKFKKNNIIIKKNYFLEYIMKDKNYYLIIIIIYNKYIFFLNSNI